MAKYRFYYILFAVVSTVLMFSYKSKLTSVLFLITIAIPVISFVLLVFSRLLVKIRIEYRYFGNGYQPFYHTVVACGAYRLFSVQEQRKV